MQNQIMILNALTAGRSHSWGGSEKQAFNLSSDRKSLAAREPESGGRFFRARAVRFMFRARPFVIMAECKQTDIIWRLLHHYQDLPLLHVQNWQKKAPEKGRKILFCDCCFLFMLVSFRPIQINITVEIYDCFFYDGNLFMMVFFYYGNLFLY